MLNKYSDYTITLPGYKMQFIYDVLKTAEVSPVWKTTLETVLNEIENAKEKEYAE